MTATGWPFLIARGRRRGYSVLLAPPLLRKEYGVLEDVVGPASGVQVATVRGACVVWEEYGVTEADIGGEPSDEHSRPLRLLHGVVSRERVEPSEVDMGRVRAVALETYRRFLADEEGFAVEWSEPVAVPVRRRSQRSRRWLALPVAAAGVLLAVVVIIATSEPEPGPPPPCPTTTAPATAPATTCP